CRDERPDFVELERSDLLERQAECGELRLLEISANLRQKSLSNSKNARQDFVVQRDDGKDLRGQVGRDRSRRRGKLLPVGAQPEQILGFGIGSVCGINAVD